MSPRTTRPSALIRLGIALSFLGCGGGTSHTPGPRVLGSINLTPADSSIPADTTQQFAATGAYSDGTTQDLTKTVAWTSSDGGVATVDANGLATGRALGAASIVATSGAVKGTASLKVTAAVSVSVSPRVASVTFTQTQQFQATVQNTPDTAVAWSVDGVESGNSSVGTITANGLYAPPATTGAHQIRAASHRDPSKDAAASLVVTDYPGAWTYHNDNFRSGQDLQEIILTPQNVNSTRFGKLFSYPVDGPIFGQPLYVENVELPARGFHNVVYVATEHDSVYAFDADKGAFGTLWHTSFVDANSGITAVPCADEPEACAVIGPEVGITGTPVIDPATDTLYVAAFTKEQGKYVHRLHALDLKTGAEKFGGPVPVEGSVTGTGDASTGSSIEFNPYYQLQRSALLLSKGTVYISFASFGDNRPYQGWVFGYNAQTLQRVSVLNLAPNGSGAGIWQSACGPAADDDGNIYLVTGNGTFDADVGGQDFGDSFLKLMPGASSLSVIDYFTPFDQAVLYNTDGDLGAGGSLLLPDQTSAHPHLVVGGGKEGILYLVDRDSMGHFHAGDNTHSVQTLRVGYLFSTPAYWQAKVYIAPVDDALKVFPLKDGLLSTAPASQSPTKLGFPGATPAVSANGSQNGIVWVLQNAFQTGLPAVLRAYDANDVSQELYDTTQAPARDALPLAGEFPVPTIANGKVYVGAVGELSVFGLLP